MASKLEDAILAGGCYWCTEAVFKNIRGVQEVVSGFTGGSVKDPSYQEVCSGDTGHAECIKITFATDQIGYQDLLAVFFATHDPTTPNRQGPDYGSQYRSAIFYTNTNQLELANRYIQKLNAAHVFEAAVITEVKKLDIFYSAQASHQNYYEQNKENRYCQFAIPPKLKTVRNKFASLLKQ